MDLTKGNVTGQIFKLSMPIIGTSFVQMTYNFADMAWLGRLGSDAVAAVGTATFFMWLGNALLNYTKIGAEVGVSQSSGRKDKHAQIAFAETSLTLSIITSLVYGLIVIAFAPKLIGMFMLKNEAINAEATTYLQLIAAGMIFSYTNLTFSGIFNAKGNSRLPFILIASGLVINIILDPILIFGWSIIPAMGSQGAAIATVATQALVFLAFCWIYKSENGPVKGAGILRWPDIKHSKLILKYGGPAAAQMSLFACFAMVIASLVAKWGALPIAVQSVGTQIEAISWMTAAGFSTALSTFVGQNFGAGKSLRIKLGITRTFIIGTIVGLATSSLFYFAGSFIYKIFLPEPSAIELGSTYLKILGVSQIFMIWEIVLSGLYFGLGKSKLPSIIGILFTGLRIPIAILLSDYMSWGVAGIWWSITISSIFKGLLMVFFGFRILNKKQEVEEAKSVEFAI
ncbi:MATE family efflux transporter [Aureibacter tunicatorum]|uniref:Multidrug-efflux transporter n=1 Tax=Aureibacter tunicatorum TaxID=866807 RepID=A0AAE4BRZ3_9BACT|nr:MATE family efflux transporter [Aureibacter tunicatorum]MDR6240684.1 putative MATE family efflux protein [Aureibacter tunicatorum]BDD06983.1 MATE family efflux transporter [Aureibacter tunicatorum]